MHGGGTVSGSQVVAAQRSNSSCALRRETQHQPRNQFHGHQHQSYHAILGGGSSRGRSNGGSYGRTSMIS